MKYLLSIALLGLFLTSCSSKKTEGKTEAEVLYKDANSLIADKRYILATEKLNLLRSQYPYSFYSTHAELLQADILFLQENFVEAAASYILFRDFHPRYKRMPYVVWKIAESFYQQIPSTFDRDLSPALEAIKYFQELVAKYPRSDYSKESRDKIKQASQKLELKEQYIADFYYKTEEYMAAISRYESILKLVKNKDIADHARVRIVEAYLNGEDYQKCLSEGKKYIDTVSENRRNSINNAMNLCQSNINAM